jgi:polyhydroxybutyrate depolymerase
VTDSAARPLVALACVLASLLLAACGSAAQSSEATTSSQPLPAGFTRFSVATPEGRVRSYIVYAPSGTATRRPLVLVYHGAEATAEGTAQETDFVQAADRDGFDVAFMQGYKDTWNEGAGGTPARVAHVNDVQYTSAALSQIERHYSIDPSRVAASGFSNGALLTQLLGCQLADRLAVVVPAEGPLPVSVSPSCHPAQPISVLEIHGTADQTIPYGGGHFDGVGGGTTVLSAAASTARWAALNGCRGSQHSSQDGGKALLTTYSPCRGGVVVQFRALVGRGHNWPPEIGVLVGEFLSRHPHAAATERSG